MKAIFAACLALACASPAHQARPGAAPVQLLEPATLDTGNAKPNSDRGPEQPLWPGAGVPMVAQVIESPRDPVRTPPEMARLTCSAWYLEWLYDHAGEATAEDDGGWFSSPVDDEMARCLQVVTGTPPQTDPATPNQ